MIYLYVGGKYFIFWSNLKDDFMSSFLFLLPGAKSLILSHIGFEFLVLIKPCMFALMIQESCQLFAIDFQE